MNLAPVMAITTSCGFEFPFLGAVYTEWTIETPTSAGNDCYSKNVHADEPEVQMKTQGEKARYAHRGGRFGLRGLVTGACFADLGHEVVLVDNDEKSSRHSERRGADS